MEFAIGIKNNTPTHKDIDISLSFLQKGPSQSVCFTLAFSFPRTPQL